MFVTCIPVRGLCQKKKKKPPKLYLQDFIFLTLVVLKCLSLLVVVVLLFNVHDKQLRLCRDGQNKQKEKRKYVADRV